MPPTTEVLGLLAGSEERQVQLVLLPDVHPLDVTDETWAELSVPAHALKDQSLPTLAALQASFSQKVLALLLLVPLLLLLPLLLLVLLLLVLPLPLLLMLLPRLLLFLLLLLLDHSNLQGAMLERALVAWQKPE